jgi:hypothetical protein
LVQRGLAHRRRSLGLHYIAAIADPQSAATGLFDDNYISPQDIDMPKAQLRGDGMIHVDIEVQSDGHYAPSLK